jgi:hypothetical protein
MDFWSVGRRVLFCLGNGVSCGLCSVVLGCAAAWTTLKVTKHRIKPGPDGMGGGQAAVLVISACGAFCAAVGLVAGLIATPSWQTLAICSGASAAFGGLTLSILAKQL